MLLALLFYSTSSIFYGNRADYNPDQYLWEKDFTLAGRKYKREDLEASMGIRPQLLFSDEFVANLILSCSEPGHIMCFKTLSP